MNRFPKLLIVLAALVLVVFCGLLGFRSFSLAARPAQQASSGAADIGGPFSLVSNRDQPVTDKTFRGKWEVLYFGYTHCPDECPVALANLSTALHALGSKANTLQSLFVTVDPTRDTPKVMGRYLKSFDKSIIGLTGSQAQIQQAEKDFRVYAAPANSHGKDLILNHSIFFYVMNPKGRFVTVINGNTTAQKIAARLRALTTAS
ncbi:MAG TPA: SCO family protein [Beijerinckiaceae bacterium]|nr:SCO family protein [Beijerinckiaceae bacterium]